MTEVSSRLRRVDVLIYAILLLILAFHFFSSERTPDFTRDDVFYSDAARSILQHGYYGINGHPEANQPPGLPALLALLCLAGSCSHLFFLRTMAVLEALGFLLSYELLRRQTSRAVAASVCLLLISSRTLFWLATQWVFPCFPYFFASIAALLVIRKFESSTRPVPRIAWGVLLTALIAACLMFMSAAIAFLGAIVASIVVLFFRNRPLAFSRLRMYAAVLLIGIMVQGFWMHRKPTTLEWPLPGYPQSYLSQLKVKSGNAPELGFATLSDIPVRILRNAADDAVILSGMLLKRWIDVAWMSALVSGPILLIALGWFSSLRHSEGGLQEWYFAGYEFIYLLWPWKVEARFFVPVVPLACLYLWRGGKSIARLAKDNPRLLGVAWYPVAVILTVSCWFWMFGSWIASHLTHAGLQDEGSFLVWLSSAILAIWMIWADSSWRTSMAAFSKWCYRPVRPLGLSPLRISQYLGIAAVAALTVTGIGAQLKIARGNWNRTGATARLPADVQAAQWISAHTGGDAVVMARHVPIVYHYAARQIVWFPPSANPQLLMDGIQRHQISFVVVVSRDDSYYLPSDEDSFAAVFKIFPERFRLVYQAPSFRIFQVLPDTQLALEHVANAPH